MVKTVNIWFITIQLLGLLILTTAGVQHVLVPVDTLKVIEPSTPSPPPRPYAFGYAAGRHIGHIDRTHSEVSDGSGVVQGSFSYIDPKNEIRTVDYIADAHGFHPVLSHNPAPLPKDSAAVAAAKERHLQRYNAIAESHQRAHSQPGYVAVPADTKAVEYAKHKHLDLYQKIAEEHARIAADLKAQKLARGEPLDEEEFKQHL